MLHSSKADNIGSGDVWQIYSGLEIASYDLKRDQHLSRMSGVDWHKSHSPEIMYQKFTYPSEILTTELASENDD